MEENKNRLVPSVISEEANLDASRYLPVGRSLRRLFEQVMQVSSKPFVAVAKGKFKLCVSEFGMAANKPRLVRSCGPRSRTVPVGLYDRGMEAVKYADFCWNPSPQDTVPTSCSSLLPAIS